MQDNRREHPRFNTALSVEVFTSKGVLAAEGNNLSQGGLGITLDSPLDIESEVGLSMFLIEDGIEDEQTAPLNIKGVVCWSTEAQPSGHQAGMRFISMTALDLEKIQFFLHRLNNNNT